MTQIARRPAGWRGAVRVGAIVTVIAALLLWMGGALIDVTVEHSVYGQICAPLHIFSRYDADAFYQKIQQPGARPLCDLTGGIHLHTLRAADEATLDRIVQGLKDKGFLLSEDK